jgi:hypothetical protein
VLNFHNRKAIGRLMLAVSTVAAGSGLTIGPAMAASGAAAPAPPFTQCPAIGSAASCKILLVVNSDETVSSFGDPAAGPYDGSDDTTVGIVNDSSAAVKAVTVSGPGSGLSLFDGDGICSGQFATWTGSSGCPYGRTGYEGPGTSFVTSASLPDSAEVDFAGGLAPGASAYFSLEGELASAELTAREGPLTCDAVYPAASTRPDYCIPQDWDAHTVSSSPVPGVEPLNVIISANSTVPLADVLGALRGWDQVATGTPETRPRGCLSEERANVSGSGGMVPQAQSWRLAGCYTGGGALAALGLENHIRIWNQPVPGSAAGSAWFITASFEYVCRSPVPDRFWWHCINHDGYNDGAAALVRGIELVGYSHNWTVTVRRDWRNAGTGGTGANSGTGTGLNNVPYSGHAWVVTVTS